MRRGLRGFTLMELLIVVVIISLTAAVLAPQFESLSEAGSEERALRLLSGAIARAQDLATLEHQPVSIIVDLTTRHVTLGPDRKAGLDPESLELPRRCRIGIEQEDGGGVLWEGRVTLTVDQDGYVNPFRVRIGDHVRLKVHPFTGELEPEAAGS